MQPYTFCVLCKSSQIQSYLFWYHQPRWAWFDLIPWKLPSVPALPTPSPSMRLGWLCVPVAVLFSEFIRLKTSEKYLIPPEFDNGESRSSDFIQRYLDKEDIVLSGFDFVKYSFKNLRAEKMASLGIKANNLWDPTMLPCGQPYSPCGVSSSNLCDDAGHYRTSASEPWNQPLSHCSSLIPPFPVSCRDSCLCTGWGNTSVCPGLSAGTPGSSVGDQ